MRESGWRGAGFSATAIAALALDVLVGRTGQLSLAHAAFLGIGAFATGNIGGRGVTWSMGEARIGQRIRRAAALMIKAQHVGAQKCERRAIVDSEWERRTHARYDQPISSRIRKKNPMMLCGMMMRVPTCSAMNWTASSRNTPAVPVKRPTRKTWAALLLAGIQLRH